MKMLWNLDLIELGELTCRILQRLHTRPPIFREILHEPPVPHRRISGGVRGGGVEEIGRG